MAVETRIMKPAAFVEARTKQVVVLSEDKYDEFVSKAKKMKDECIPEALASGMATILCFGIIAWVSSIFIANTLIFQDLFQELHAIFWPIAWFFAGISAVNSFQKTVLINGVRAWEILAKEGFQDVPTTHDFGPGLFFWQFPEVEVEKTSNGVTDSEVDLLDEPY